MCFEIVDPLLLFAVDLTGKQNQHQLPRLQIELHRRLGSGKSETIGGGGQNVERRGRLQAVQVQRRVRCERLC